MQRGIQGALSLRRNGRAAIAFVLCVLLSFALPMPALAYFDRGSVGVEIGASQIQVWAGETMDVSVSLTPSADEQTEGCGMPKCPQSCAETCMDDLGQCRCAGSERTTYYPTAVASSSNASVAMAVYRSGRLSVFGRSEGTATITLTASLRQFTDGEATLEVSVVGSADGPEGIVVPPEFLEMPEVADVTADDRQDLVEKTAMGRPIRFVRIGGNADAEGVLASLVGTDGETTFWSGDTLHQPDYSLTVLAADCTEADAERMLGRSTDSLALEVTTVPEGKLTQALAGLDGFVAVSFADDAALPCTTTVYARAMGALADGEEVSLYSYDEDAKSFVEEEAAAEVVGGYVKFATDAPRSYVVSSRDLVQEANRIVEGSSADGAFEGDAVGATVPWAVPIALLVIMAIAAIAVVRIRSKRKASR